MVILSVEIRAPLAILTEAFFVIMITGLGAILVCNMGLLQQFNLTMCICTAATKPTHVIKYPILAHFCFNLLDEFWLWPVTLLKTNFSICFLRRIYLIFVTLLITRNKLFASYAHLILGKR